MSVITIGMIALFLAGVIVFGMLLADLAVRQRNALKELRKIRVDTHWDSAADARPEPRRRPPCQ